MRVADLAEFCKCLSSDTRLKIIRLLAEKELCVCELEEITGQTQSGISQHLRILFSAGLVDKRRDGQWIYYKLEQARFLELHAALAALINTSLENLGDFAQELAILKSLNDNERVKKCKSGCSKSSGE